MKQPSLLPGARRQRPPSAKPAPAVATEVAALRAKVEAIEAQVRAVPDRLAGIARTTDAQRKRLDGLVVAQDRAQATLAQIVERLGTPPRGASVRRRIAALAERVRAWARRLGARVPHRTEAAAAQTPTPAPAPTPTPDWILAGGRVAPGARAVLVVLFGVDAAEREAAVARLLATPPVGGTVLQPVFLTDSSDFAALRRHRALFEYLPGATVDRPGAPTRDWELYRARRLALLCGKWRPVQVVALGPTAARQLEAWRHSPHLGEAIKELLAVAAAPPTARATGTA